MFQDRTAAGRQLAAALVEREIEADLVLAIPRGGLPVGRAVADAFDRPLDIIVTAKIGAPGNPEFAVGAVASDGSTWLDGETIERLGVDSGYIEAERERVLEAAQSTVERYRGERSPPNLAGRAVVIVDDGVATGATAIAAARMAREHGAEQIIVAVPVSPPDSVTDLSKVADTVVCLAAPLQFDAVGQFYEQFDQVSDEAAMAYLHDE